MKRSATFARVSTSIIVMFVLLAVRPVGAEESVVPVVVRPGHDQAGRHVDLTVSGFWAGNPHVQWEQRQLLKPRTASPPWAANDLVDQSIMCLASLDTLDGQLVTRPAVQQELRAATNAKGNEVCRQQGSSFDSKKALRCLRCWLVCRHVSGWPGMTHRLAVVVPVVVDGPPANAKRAIRLRLYIHPPQCTQDAACGVGARCWHGVCESRALRWIRREPAPLTYAPTRATWAAQRP